MEKWTFGEQQKEIRITDEDRRVHESYIKSLGISRQVSHEEKSSNEQIDINDVKLKGLKSNVQMEITTMLRNTIGDPYEEPISDSFSTSMTTPELIVSSNPSSDYNSSRELENEGFMGFAKHLRNDNPIHVIASNFPGLKISENKAQATKNKSEQFPALVKAYPRGRGRGRAKPPVQNVGAKGFVKDKTSISYDNIDYSRNAAITSLLSKNNCTIETNSSMEDYSRPADTTEEIIKEGVSSANEYVKDWLENRIGNRAKNSFQPSIPPLSEIYKFLTDDGDFEYVPCVEQS